MSKFVKRRTLGPRNPILIRFILILITVVAFVGVIFLAIKILLTEESLVYNLGDVKAYSDTILTSYEDYQELVNIYKIKEDLTKEDFDTSSYLASFQEYDKCSEKKYKEVENIYSGSSITITYKIYNKCGWCKSKTILYLIKIPKTEDKNLPINYEYTYDKNLECGTI